MKNQFPNMSLKSLTQLFTLVQISEFTRKQGRITFVSPYEQSLFYLFVERRGEGKKVSLISIRIQ